MSTSPSFPAIHSIVTLPTASSHASPRSLQWSSDGQLCFSTKGAVYIMAPNCGITHDASSAVKSTLTKEEEKEDKVTIAWFRTLVQPDFGEFTKWPEYSQDWGTISLGSMDLTLSKIAISPVGLSDTAGCILATLTSNMDLTLWSATKNALKGEWRKVCEVTPYLITVTSSEEGPEDTQANVHDHASRITRTLRAQVTSIDWTTEPDFGLAPVPILPTSGSLLVAGNRAGAILLLRYPGPGNVNLLHELSVSEYWITQLAFGAWECTQSGTVTGVVAYGTSSGAIGLARITQTLVEKATIPVLTPEFDVWISFQNLGLVYQPDKCSVTSLRWIIPPVRSPILVFSKPGRLFFWSEPSASTLGSPPVPELSDKPVEYWSGLCSLNLKTQKIHRSSSALHPVTGITYVAHQDALLVPLFDGSIHVVHELSKSPTLDRVGGDTVDLDSSPTSSQLSKVVRKAFSKVERREADWNDANRVTGFSGFSGESTMIWAQESARPADCSYKHDAMHSSTLVVAQLWEERQDAKRLFLEDLSHTLDTVKASSGYGPLYTLRPYLFRLSNPYTFNELLGQLLLTLQIIPDDHSLSIILPPCMEPLSTEIRKKFRNSLSTHLFGYDSLASLRMKMALADFTWKMSDTEEKRHECGLAAQTIVNAITHRSLRTIVRHLVAVASLVQSNDLPFILRVIILSLLPGCLPDLATEAQNLFMLIQTMPAAQTSSPALASAFNNKKTIERCPACGIDVPLQDVTIAVCSNGHVWTRCSITTFILSTPYVRTCMGCSRKAFLPSSAREGAPPLSTQVYEISPLAGGWIIEELLEAVQRCLFCNNVFVRVL